MAITFQNSGVRLNLKDKKKLKAWIVSVIKNEKKHCGQVNFLFTTDQDVLEKNQQFLSHSTLTDIITFDYTESNTVNGDIIISIERVRENAAKFSSQFNDELRRVMIHGILHLCGYKDKSEEEKKLMRRREDRSLRIFQEM
jgi:probable rRNA maturation factor